jgi:hypothetical protein
MQTVITKNSTKYISAVMLGILGAAALGTYWGMRLAVASWLETRATLSASVHAIALAPGNEEYLRRAA